MLLSADTISTITPAPTSTATAWPPTSLRKKKPARRPYRHHHPFFEYGKSHYASYLDTGARGDGRQHYTGGGILLRRDLDSGLYYEGAVRAGYLKGDFHGMIAKSMSRYDSGAPYIAAQAGLGKIYTRNRDSYDIYGKFFYTYLGSDSAVVHSGYGDSKYDFDSINSYVTRLGMRWTRDFDQIRSLYAGIGWDYEAGSKPDHLRRLEYPKPDRQRLQRLPRTRLEEQDRQFPPMGRRPQGHRLDRQAGRRYLLCDHQP